MAGVLRAEDLAVWRGGRAVFAGLSLAVAPGDALLLTGPNGAGKSSLLRALAGLLRPAEGRITWDGADIAEDRPAHGARLRWLGHAEALKPALTLREDLIFWARLLGGDPSSALAALGLEGLADLPCRVLSAGQRRRLALSRLLLGEAPLWLLDEPTLGLDAESVSRLGPVFAGHRARGGMLVIATHLPLPLSGTRELRL